MKNLIKILILSILTISCDNSQKEDQIIVGTSPDNIPHEFIQNGEIVGLDIDLIKAIGKKINKKVIIKSFDFNGLLAAVISENVDIVVAGLTITPERAKHISFSKPYMTTRLSILYRASDDFKNIDELDNKIIGVQLGSTWEIIARNLAENRNIKISSLTNNLMLVEELKSKAVDAVILEEFQSKKFIQNNPGLASFSLESFPSEFAIGMSKDSGLLKKVNEAIDDLKKDGTIDEIIKKWLE